MNVPRISLKITHLTELRNHLILHLCTFFLVKYKLHMDAKSQFTKYIL